MLYFFFQAEDGIRDYKVTGVQTCALPIYGGERGEHAAADVLETEDVVERRRRLDREVAQIDRRGRARGGGCGAGGGGIGRASGRERVGGGVGDGGEMKRIKQEKQ